MRQKRTTATLVVLALLLALAPACGPKYNIQTNPVGAVAFNADQVTQINGRVAKAIMTAEASKLLATTRAADALRICKQLDVKAVELAAALTELDKMALDDLARKPIVERVAGILDAMNVLIFQVVIPLNDDPLRVQISQLLTNVSKLLLTVAMGIR